MCANACIVPSIMANHSSDRYFPLSNHSSVSADTAPTLTHIHHLIIITGALLICFCCLLTMVYCVETIANRRRQVKGLRITPANDMI